MVFFAALLFFAALVALAAALGMISVPNRTVRNRVKAIAQSVEPPSDEPEKIKLAGQTSDSFLERFTPAGMMQRIERNMVLAGRPEGWSRDRVIIMKPAGLAFGLFIALMLLMRDPGFLIFLVALGVIALGYFLPDILIYNSAIKRQEQIQKELPDTLDQIVISIEAGVGFEASLARAAENGHGPLADELVRLIQDIAVGLSRREAYLALADRTSVDELRAFAKAIVQAEEYGMSVVTVVRSQAQEMRIGRRTRAEEKAQKVPVKILLPLMICILPVLFVIVVGPAIVPAIESGQIPGG